MLTIFLQRIIFIVREAPGKDELEKENALDRHETPANDSTRINDGSISNVVRV